MIDLESCKDVAIIPFDFDHEKAKTFQSTSLQYLLAKKEHILLKKKKVSFKDYKGQFTTSFENTPLKILVAKKKAPMLCF